MTANRYYLSGGHQDTLKAAADILDAGGNAVDAAIAAFVASWVAEPAMASAGGGAFATIKMAGQRPRCFDFFCATPRIKKDITDVSIDPVDIDFGDAIERYYIGMGSIAIPGAVRGIFLLHRQFGSMPIRELLYPGSRLAKEGVVMNDFQHLDLNLLKDIFGKSDVGKDIYFHDGKIKPVGHSYGSSELADFIETLGIEGEDLFYRGEVARSIVEDSERMGGVIDQESLSSYKANEEMPLLTTAWGRTIATMGQPSLGGALLVYVLKSLDDSDPDHAFLSEDYMHWLADHLASGKRAHESPSQLIRQLGLNWPIGDSRQGSTSHFNVVDRHGNAVSLTMTIGEGSGYFVPGTGIHMNNMLGEPALLPDGIHSWLPGHRLHSLMAPTVVLDDAEQVDMVLGTGGAARIPFMLAQVLMHHYRDGQPLQAAIERPRLYHDGQVLQVEDALHWPAMTSMRTNRWPASSLFFGGVHALARNGDRFDAVGDQRRDGVVLVRN